MPKKIKTTAKELARSLLQKAGLINLVETILGKKKTYLEHENVGDRFAQIYQDGVWQRGKSDVPLSGEGSSLIATQKLRAGLPELLRFLEVERLLDLGCGDFTWMSHVDLAGIDYIGADIVSGVIENNRQRFQRPGRQFIVANGIAGPLPSVDAVLCREVLFHLSFADAKSLLGTALQTGAKHFLLTTDSATSVNSDIRTGHFRALNLLAAPFRLPASGRFIEEDASLPGRRLAVWSASEIRRALEP